MNIQKITNFFFLLTVFSLPLYLVRLTFLSLPTNALEIMALFSIILFFISQKKPIQQLNQSPLRPAFFAISILFIGLILSFLLSGPTLPGLGIIKGWFIMPLFFSFFLASKAKGDNFRTKTILVLYLSILTIALISTYYLLNDALTYDGRLAAPYLSPNHLAMYLAPGFFLGFYLSTKINTKLFKFLIFFSLLIIAYPFYLTYSYSAWLSVAFSFLFLFLLKKIGSKKVLLMTFLVSVLVFSAFSFQLDKPKLNGIFESRSSLSSRLMIWKSSLKIAKDHPVFGIGPGNFQKTYLEYQRYYPPYLEWAVPQPHNIYLAFYLQAGLLGLIGFSMICLYWLRSGLQQKNTTFTIVSLGILFYILFHGFIDTPYWKNDLSYLFWIVFFLTISFSKDRPANQSSNL